jgi:hypothetical protein
MTSARPDLDPVETPEPSVLRSERRLRLLQELSRIGMDLARALNRGVQGEADPAEAFARLSHAIRLTLALEGRVDEALRALQAEVVLEREDRRAEALRRAAADAEGRRQAHRKKVRKLVVEVIERESGEMQDFIDLEEALDERLEEDEAYDDLERLPLRETVEKLCADLQITPDWSRWVGDGWTPREPFFRASDSVFLRPSRHPTWRVETSGPAELAYGSGGRE